MDFVDKVLLNEALQNLGLDPLFIIRETFLGYKYRKQNKKLYDSDKNFSDNLIRIYYGLNDRVEFDILKKTFVSHYIKQESKLEEVDIQSKHSLAEIKGLEKMYEYIHSSDIDYMFNVYTLKELHEKLFSLTQFADCAGNFRNSLAYLAGTETDLCDWTMIRTKLNELDNEVLAIVELGKEINKMQNVTQLSNYINRCVILNCQLIRIHPFFDGNGRVIRGFTNKLFEYAGLPPIYIKASEKEEYLRAMRKSDEEDYTDIINFYKYKICDSIVELDINQRLKESVIEENKEKMIKKGTPQ